MVTSRVEAVRPLGSGSRRSRVIRNSFQLPCSDSDESDDDVLSVGAVRPLPNAAPLGEAEMVDVRQRHADVEDDVFFMRARGPMDRPGMCCTLLDDFDWVVPPYVPDLVWPGGMGPLVLQMSVGRSVRCRWSFRRWRKGQLEDRCPGLWLSRRSHMLTVYRTGVSEDY